VRQKIAASSIQEKTKAVVYLNVIYIDVLIVLNIYVNYFLIKATSKISHSSLRTSGLVFSSVIGSLFSLVILLPRISFLLMFLIKMASALLIVIMAFGKKSLKEYMRLAIYFYIINFSFAGIILSLRYLFGCEYISVCNTFVYVDVSLFSLMIFTAVSYFTVCFIRNAADRGAGCQGNFSVTIKNSGMSVSFEGLADTGNSVTDMFSGKPVIVCPENIIKIFTGINSGSCDIYDVLAGSEKIKGTRLVPYSTIDGDGLLPAFTPDEVIIRGGNITRNVDVLVGVKETHGKAVFNPSILS
jgi:stage II sporulation protein GA (sporulation sigma-E factor processing peptidase)